MGYDESETKDGDMLMCSHVTNPEVSQIVTFTKVHGKWIADELKLDGHKPSEFTYQKLFTEYD